MQQHYPQYTQQQCVRSTDTRTTPAPSPCKHSAQCGTAAESVKPASASTPTPSPPPTPQQCRRQNSSTVVLSSLPPQNALTMSATPYSPSHPSTIMTQPTPAQFDVVNHPVKETLMIVSSLLSMLVHKNDSCYNPQRDPITLFHSRAVPRISIEAYLTRVLQYIPFTNEVLLNVLVYLDRIGGLEGMQLQQPPSPSSSPSMTPVTATSTSMSSASLPLSPSTSLLSAHTVPTFCKAASSSPSSSSPAAAATVSTTARVPNVPSVVPCSCISDSSPPTIQKRGREQQESGDELVMDQQKRPRTAATVSVQAEGTVAPPSVPHVPTATATPVHSAANGFRVNSFNIHRLLITCLMVAAKFTSDLFYSNARYAKVGGLSLPELNQLELEFLFTTKFELNVKVDELQRVGNALLSFRDRQMVPVLLQEQLRRQKQHELSVQLYIQQQQQQQQRQLQQQQQQCCQPVSQQQQQSHQHANPPQKQGVTYAIPSPITPTNSFSGQQAGAGARPGQAQSSQTHLLSPPEEKNRLAESEIHDVV